MRSQALKLSSSQAYSRWHSNWPQLLVTAWLCLPFVLTSSCNHAANEPNVAVEVARTNSLITIDLGVVFADECYYRCVTFERLGMPKEAHVERIESSCECINSHVVSVETSQGPVEALLIEYRPVKNVDLEVVRPTILAVAITLVLSGGEPCRLSLRFLETRKTGSQDNQLTSDTYSAFGTLP